MSWRGVRVGGCGGRRVTGEGSQVGLNICLLDWRSEVQVGQTVCLLSDMPYGAL